jgi:hypothetical protein
MTQDAQPQNPAGQSAEIKIVGYCRTCGTGLDEVNVRMANGTIYCAEHVPKESAAQSSSSPGQQQYQSAYAHSPYTAPPQGDGASPGAAFVLGMIPGVGAIYNGQYAKGIVHVVILAMLFMAADSATSGAQALFVFLIPGFWFYMAFEAYHTARRRRDGLPIDEFSSLGMGTSGKFPVAPVLLIAFGTLFLLDNLGVLEIRKILKLWPAMMIAIGVYMLYVRMTGDSGKSGSPGGSPGGSNDPR